jgi:hypothetical protein
MDRLRALPGVELVGLVENIPLNEGTFALRVRSEGMTGDADTGPLVRMTFAAGDYYKAMGIDLVEGRVFETNDHLSALPNVVISRSAARLLGRRICRRQAAAARGTATWFTVVGVVAT